MNGRGGNDVDEAKSIESIAHRVQSSGEELEGQKTKRQRYSQLQSWDVNVTGGCTRQELVILLYHILQQVLTARSLGTEHELAFLEEAKVAPSHHITGRRPGTPAPGTLSSSSTP